MKSLLKQVIIDKTNQPVDILFSPDGIENIAPDLSQDGATVYQGEGKVVLPGLVEGHIHLDKALIADRAQNKSGTLMEAIEVTGKLKTTFTKQDIHERASRALEMIVSKGSTFVRSHPEFDPSTDMRAIEVMLDLKSEWQKYIDIQLVAFPQEGIIQRPGTKEMIIEAMRMGADVVGGVPYNDTDAKEHIDIVFEIAKQFDKDIDLHQDFKDDYHGQSIEYLCHKTIAEGYHGRVNVGHLTTLATMPEDELDKIIQLMAEADISVFALPMTDLHLGGRGDKTNVRRLVTPIRKLRDGGVNVSLASNNIRNPFTPYGNGDLLQVAMLAIPVAHLGGADDIGTVLPMITSNPARALKLKNYGLEIGNRADIVLLNTDRFENAIIDIPERLMVFKNGQLTVETTYRKKLV